jgi:hypothetical protein
MTKSQATRLVAGLMAPYRTAATITGETFDAYVEDILDLDYEPAALAIKQLRQTATFLPSIAEVRQAAAEITAGHLPDGDQAWAEVVHQIRTVGHTGRPAWSHPAIAETVRAMGWLELCASTNQVADRAHFLRLYANARTRHDQTRLVDPTTRQLASSWAEQYALDVPKTAGAGHPLARWWTSASMLAGSVLTTAVVAALNGATTTRRAA